jgi:hypothetical protein
MKQRRQTVIGKSALVIAATSEKNMAAQIFNYDDVREVRLDMDSLEVKLLMKYDEAYFRVYSIKPQNNTDEAMKAAQAQIMKFYNDLVNASMKITKEELETIQKQREEFAKKAQENSKETVVEETTEETAEEN